MVWNPLNGFQIILSRNHGFVQVFDLYTFPYFVGNAFRFSRGHDYYTDLVLGNLGTCDLCIDHIPTVNNSVFRLFQLNIPTTMEIFDFAAGDIYESLAILSRPWPSMSIDETQYILDSVTAKTATAYNVSYSGTENMLTTITAGTTPYIGYSSSHFPATSGFATSGDTTLLFPAQRLPEEWNAPFLLHYYPKIRVEGTCDSSEVWEVDGDYKDYAHGITYNFATGYYDAAYIARSYEKGLGMVGMQQFPAGPFGSDMLQQNYVYYSKSGTDCGHFVGVVPNAVPAVNKSSNIIISPNPAGSDVYVATAGLFEQGTIISVYDMTGKCIFNTKADAQKNTLTINTSTWPDGLYMVIVQNNGGIVKKEKVVIRH